MFRIGEFARLAGVSVRALHHYDDLGLVSPSGRTPSGHRLYDASQLQEVRRVTALARLGFTLDEVGAVTHGALNEPLKNVLARKLAELEGERTHLEDRIAALRAELDQEHRMSQYTVQLKSLGAQPVLVAHALALNFRAVSAPMEAAYDTALRAHAASHLPHPGWCVVTWRGGGYESEEAIDLEVALPVFGSQPTNLGDAVTFEVQPDMLVASTVHVGSYERFGEAYAAVLSWTQERGFEVSGPVREVYLRVGEREEEHLSELQVPIRMT